MKKNHISPEDLEKLISTLDALPPKPKEALSTRETVASAETAIRGALEKGYSFTDIAEHFARFRLSVRPGTISGYLANLEPKPAAQKKAGKPKALKPTAPSKVAAPALHSDMPAEPSLNNEPLLSEEGSDDIDHLIARHDPAELR
ncbi:MAG TPA: hypothetical protein PKY73_00345 [Hyphomonas sp.]|nr:hypothetical protein [Hyphomonas sp.]